MQVIFPLQLVERDGASGLGSVKHDRNIELDLQRVGAVGEIDGLGAGRGTVEAARE